MATGGRYDFESLIDSAVGMPFGDMCRALDSECARVEASMSGREGPKARANGAGEYVARIKRVLFWCHHGVLADRGQERSACRRIAEKLVENGEMKPEALDRMG